MKPFELPETATRGWYIQYIMLLYREMATETKYYMERIEV